MKKGSKHSLYKSNENLQPAIKILDYKLNADIVYIERYLTAFQCFDGKGYMSAEVSTY